MDNRTFSWANLTALNSSPSVMFGLTMMELGVCLLVCLCIGLVVAFPIAAIAGNGFVYPLAALATVLLLFRFVAGYLGKIKTRYGDKMFMVKIKKTLQAKGLWDFDLELSRKKWTNKRIRRKL